MPPYLRRTLVRFFVIIVIGSVLSVVVPMVLSPRRVHLSVYIAAVALPGVAMGLAGAWFGFATNKHIKRAAELKFRVCWECGYHLRGLGDEGTCPECGKTYTLAELREKWTAGQGKSGRAL